MKILFEYKCGTCGHEEEHLMKRTDSSVVKCDKCGSNAFKKISTSAFTFKEGHGKGTSGGHSMRFAR